MTDTPQATFTERIEALSAETWVRRPREALLAIAREADDALRTEREARERAERERDALAQQVEALRQELATAIGQNEELRKRESQWQLKWSRAVGTGTSNSLREADRADKAEAALATARQDAARLREALREVGDAGVQFDDPRMDYVVVQLDRVAWNELAALTATNDQTTKDEANG